MNKYFGIVRMARSMLVLSLCLVLAQISLVHGASEQQEGEIIKNIDQLPAGVVRMHGAIMRAARSGKLERLQEVLEMNELKPLINGKIARTQINLWKNSSPDGSGREILAILTELLEVPPVRQKTSDGALYIWPYFAGTSLDKLSPGEIVRLYRLAPSSDVALMLKQNSYTHYRVVIGADGTWHFFGRGRD